MNPQMCFEQWVNSFEKRVINTSIRTLVEQYWKPKGQPIGY